MWAYPYHAMKGHDQIDVPQPRLTNLIGRLYLIRTGILSDAHFLSIDIINLIDCKPLLDQFGQLRAVVDRCIRLGPL